MSAQKYPLEVSIYKGEGRLLIIPDIEHRGGFYVDGGWFLSVTITENIDVLGERVIEAMEYIKTCPISTSSPRERELNASWKKCSKYKSWMQFWKNNNITVVKKFEDGRFEIFSMKRTVDPKGGYYGCIKRINLLSNASLQDIGKAITDVLDAADEYYKELKGTYRQETKVIELLDSSKLTISQPKDSRFTDNGDSGAAEIYQCYSYATSENAEPTAEFFLGIAPELDCKLDISNVRTSWEDFYGEADYFEMKEVEHGIFKYRIEMKNKDSHKISYILQQDEDLLLECGMEVHSPNRRKKTDEKLEKMFEEFALGCKM